MLIGNYYQFRDYPHYSITLCKYTELVFDSTGDMWTYNILDGRDFDDWQQINL